MHRMCRTLLSYHYAVHVSGSSILLYEFIEEYEDMFTF